MGFPYIPGAVFSPHFSLIEATEIIKGQIICGQFGSVARCV